jgi:tetratricopeptide (TPR) repeat protein
VAAEAQLFLSSVVRARGDFERALDLAESASRAFREAGDEYYIALTLHHLGEHHRDAGDHRRAEKLFAESATGWRRLGNVLDAANTLHSLGDLALDQRDFVRAARLYRESLEAARTFDAERLEAYCLAGLAAAAAGTGDRSRAACLWGAVEMIEETISTPLVDDERRRYWSYVSGPCRLEPDALASGRALTPQAAVDYALAAIAVGRPSGRTTS